MAGAVIGAQYCAQEPVVLRVQERMGFTGDSFTVTGVDGRLWFKMDAKAFSISDKKTLLDCNGQPIAGIKRKVSLRPSFKLFRGGDFTQEAAAIKQKVLTLKPGVEVYLPGNEETPAFKCKGNFLAKKFEVFAMSGGQEREIGKIAKESRFASAGAFAMAALTDGVQAYFVHGEPGADMAFLVALCVAIDEMFQEQKAGQ